MPSASPVVVVAADDHHLLDEIVRHLEEIPHWRLAASAQSAEELVEASSAHSADAVIVTAGLAVEAATKRQIPRGPRVVVIGRDESTDSLRASLTLGAAGFVVWPRDRSDVQPLVEQGLARQQTRARRGELIALWSAKGGSGTSVLSAHLAAALAAQGKRATLIDLDLDHGDQAAILGRETEPKTVADLLKVVDELSPSAVESVSSRHSRGFNIVFAGGTKRRILKRDPQDLVRIVSAVRESADFVVADVPSGFSDLAMSLAQEASSLVLLVTPDLLSIRRCRDALRMLRSSGVDDDAIHVVLNRASSGDVGPSEVAAVIGRRIVASVRAHLDLFRAPGRGDLSETGVRLIEPLAKHLLGTPSTERRGLGMLVRR